MNKFRLSLFIIVGIFLIAFAVTVTSCASDTSEKTSEKDDDGIVRLTLWMPGPNLDPLLETHIAIFEDQNPNIKVAYMTLDWGRYMQQIATAMSAGVGPDVLSVFSVNVPPLVEENVFRPLDDYEEYIDLDAFVERYLEAGVWKEKRYALPLLQQIWAFHYRSDFLAEAGYTMPPETWDDLREMAKATVQKDGAGNITRSGFWVPANHAWKPYRVFLLFLQSNGGALFDKDGKPILNSKEGLEAAQLLYNLVHVDKVDSPGTIQIENTDFGQGKVAMIASNIATRGIPENFPDIVDNVGISFIPYNKKPVVEASGQYIGVTSLSKHPKEAAQLLNFLTTDIDFLIGFAKIETGVPSIKEAQNHPYITSHPFLPKLAELGSKYGEPLPKHGKWTEISAVLSPMIDQIIIEKTPIQEALDDAAQRITKIIETN